VYGNAFPEGGTTYSSISAIGVQTRFIPFANLPGLTIRAGMSYPIARTEELRAILSAQRTQLALAGVYSTRIGPSTLTFLQSDVRWYLRNNENNRSLLVPSMAGYLVFELPNRQWYILPGMSYTIVFQQYDKGYQYKKSSQQMYGSLGVQYSPSQIVSILLSGQIPFIFDSGSSHSIWVRESYFGLNLGVRFIF
jgi:hypothetical protein